jgi:pimeloyl-ACP methyl ester carboxylesterase
MSHLFVATHGDETGPVVVAIHGGLDRGAAFLKVQRRLLDTCFVRYDRAGYAHSIHVPPRTSIGQSTEELAEVVAGREVVLLGHSLGGVIALAFAQDHLDLVRAAVIFEAPMGWTPWWPKDSAGSVAMADDRSPGAVAERFMHRMIGEERWDALPERTKQQRRDEGPALLADLRSIRSLTEPPYDVAKLQLPLVLAHGTESRGHHIESIRRLAADAPMAELHTIEGAGHAAHLSHPEAVAELVRRALELGSVALPR